MEDKKCVIRSKEYDDNTYVSGVATFESGLCNAQIFDEKKIPDSIKKDSLRYEIIYLDSKEGLELLTEEILSLNDEIPEAERRLNRMKKARDKLTNINPKLLEKYAKIYNRWNNPITGVSEKERKKIVELVVDSE